MDKSSQDSWTQRDIVYYSRPPRTIFDEVPSDMFGDTPRYKQMLNKYCGFECFIQWKYENVLFCKHNYTCCMSCGETWIRFAAPETHSMFADNYGCNKTPQDSKAAVLKHYRYIKQNCFIINASFSSRQVD